MEDKTTPSITITEPRLKFVLAIVGILGLGYTSSRYILDKEFRITAIEAQLVEMDAQYDRLDNREAKLRDMFQSLQADYSLFKARITDRTGGGGGK